MNWSKLCPWRWGHGKQAPARRVPFQARLAVESLEDRVVPSAVTDAAYQLWRQQTYTVNDVRVATAPTPDLTTQSTVPTNASFGSMIGLPSVFTNTPYRGAGYSVAVIDTGIDYNNPNLGGGFGTGHKVIAGWDFVNNDADPMDDNGHGTHVAGIVGSTNATYSGVAPDANLIALKVLDRNGSGSFGNVQNALDWVVANRARYNIVAINLSLGAGNYTTNPYTFLDTDFAALKNAGVFISVAAGNSFYTNNSAVGLDYPAVDPLVVSVGAVYDGNFGSVAWGSGARDFTTGVDHIASFSQRGPGLSIMAPGAMITSTYLNNTFQAMAGTSMASPVAAGAAVILHQAMDAKHLAANEDTILSIMKQTGVNVFDGDDENDNVTNTGLTFKRLDLGAAVAALGRPVNSAPVLQAIANQQIVPGGSLTFALNASDTEGSAITFSTSVLGASPSQAYQLEQQLGLKYVGSYYTNVWGQNEKWMSSRTGTWYCILPNGQLRKWTGSMATTLQSAYLIATLDASVYADPSLLWNAKPATAAAPTVTVNGNQLTIQAPAGATGAYQIQVVASDGSLSSTQTFTLTVQANTAPTLGAIASQSMLADRSQVIFLAARDAQNDPIAFSAKIVGTFANAPASLVVNGNQLTVYSSPDFVGSFDIQVSASNGSTSSSTLVHVNVAATPVAFRVTGDFNGDGIQDTAIMNQDGSWWFSLKKADGSFVNQNWANWTAASNWSQIKVGDFNGDGKTDIVGFTNTGSIWVGASTGSTIIPTLWTQWSAASSWTSFSVADVNGDGRLDILARNANGRWYVGYSTGAGFTTKLWTSATAPVARS